MKNKSTWKPTKYEFINGKYRGSRNHAFLAVPSRLMADLVVAQYSENIPMYATGLLADLGCGHVPLYGIYNSYVKEIVCLDWDNTIHGNEFIDFNCDLNCRLPIQEGSVDTVILSDVLEHIAAPKELLDQVYRSLKIGGVVMLNVPFTYWLHEEPYDYYRYTEHGLKFLLEQSGFKIIKITALGSFLEIVADVFCKFMVPNRKLSAIVVGCFQCVKSVLSALPFSRAIINRASAKMPLGYFVVAIR